MKIIKLLIVTTTVLLALSGAQAVPINYTYTGDFFTENQFGDNLQIPPEEQPDGFRLTNRITGFLMLDTDFWGQGEITPFLPNGDFNSGPFFAFDSLRITLDAFGSVINWGLSGAVPGFDLASGGNSDGSGRDVIFGAGWSRGAIHAAAFVDYPAGSPSRWTTEVANVPDSGSTLVMLGIGILGIFLIRGMRMEGAK